MKKIFRFVPFVNFEEYPLITPQISCFCLQQLKLQGTSQSHVSLVQDSIIRIAGGKENATVRVNLATHFPDQR